MNNNNILTFMQAIFDKSYEEFGVVVKLFKAKTGLI